MSDSDTPPAPDYVGAAKAQGAANLQAAIASGMINNPNVYNPYGNQSVTWDYQYKTDKNGNPLKGPQNIISATPTITQTLSPEQQALYNKGLVTKGNLADASIAGSNTIKGLLGKNLSFAGMPQANAPGALNYNAPSYRGIGAYNAPVYRDIGEFNGGPQYQSINAPKDRVLDTSQKRRNDVLNAMMTRVNTDTAGQRDNARSELIAAGIRPGTAAYAAQMDQIDRQYNDARNQAILSSGQEASRDFAMDQGSRQQEMADYGQKYDANAQDYGLRRDASVQNYGIRQDANLQNFNTRQNAAAQNFGIRQGQNTQDFGIQQNAAAQNFGIRQGANAQNFEMQQAARKQAIAELLAQRQTPLNEISAMMSGTQVNNPFAGGLGYQAGAGVQAAPIANGIAQQGQSAQNLYNQQQAMFNGNMAAGAGLLGSLGSAAIGAWG